MSGIGLIFITKDFAVDPGEVASLEAFEHWKHDPSPSGSSHRDHTGTVVIQKNGRKTYVRDINPSECHRLIFGKLCESEELQSRISHRSGIL